MYPDSEMLTRSVDRFLQVHLHASLICPPFATTLSLRVVPLLPDLRTLDTL